MVCSLTVLVLIVGWISQILAKDAAAKQAATPQPEESEYELEVWNAGLSISEPWSVAD